MKTPNSTNKTPTQIRVSQYGGMGEDPQPHQTLPPNVDLSSPIKKILSPPHQALGPLLSNVIFRQRSFSVKGRLPSKVILRQRSYSVGGRLPSSCTQAAPELPPI